MSLIISIVLCIPFAVRLALLIRNRIRCINVDAFSRGRAEIAHAVAPAISLLRSAQSTVTPLVSVLTVIRDASAAASFIRSMQQQSYRSVEVLIAALHPDAQQSIALKKEIAELCKRLIPHIPAFVSARVAGLNAVGMLAGAARGDLLLLVHERIIFSYESIAAAVDALSVAQCDALAVVPALSAAFRTSLAYVPAMYAVSRMRVTGADAKAGAEEFFTLVKAEQYYKYSVGGYEEQASRSAVSGARESMQRAAMLLAARENAQGIHRQQAQQNDAPNIVERVAPAVARRKAFSSRIVYPLVTPAECAARFAGFFSRILSGNSSEAFGGAADRASDISARDISAGAKNAPSAIEIRSRDIAAALLYAFVMLCIPLALFALFAWQRHAAYGWAFVAILGMSLASFCVCTVSLHYDAKKSGRGVVLQFMSREMPLRLMGGLLRWATSALALLHIAVLLCAKLFVQVLGRAFARGTDKNVGGDSSKKTRKLKIS